MRLHAKIYVPTVREEPLPFLVSRTPYGIESSADMLDTYLATFVPDIFAAADGGFEKATHTVHRSSEDPSYIVLPVVVRPPASR